MADGGIPIMSPNFHVCVPAALDALPAQASHPSTADYEIYIYPFGPWIL